MPSFNERLKAAKKAAEQEAAQKQAEEKRKRQQEENDRLKKQREEKDQIIEIKKTPEWQALSRIARNSELRKALKKYWETFSEPEWQYLNLGFLGTFKTQYRKRFNDLFEIDERPLEMMVVLKIDIKKKSRLIETCTVVIAEEMTEPSISVSYYSSRGYPTSYSNFKNINDILDYFADKIAKGQK
jgi:hypothetical protein